MNGGFTALNGLETLEVIMTKIRRALENTGEFKQNIAFPLLRFDYDLKVWAYPKQPLDGEPGIKVVGSVGEATGEPLVNVSSTKVMDTPDKERFDANLPIPVVQPAAGGILVDVRTDVPGSAKIPTRAESINAAIKAALPNKEVEGK